MTMQSNLDEFNDWFDGLKSLSEGDELEALFVVADDLRTTWLGIKDAREICNQETLPHEPYNKPVWDGKDPETEPMERD